MSPESLESLDPTFRDALHHALYAERLADAMADYAQTLALDIKDIPIGKRAKAATEKMQAQKQTALIRQALGLDG